MHLLVADWAWQQNSFCLNSQNLGNSLNEQTVLLCSAKSLPSQQQPDLFGGMASKNYVKAVVSGPLESRCEADSLFGLCTLHLESRKGIIQT